MACDTLFFFRFRLMRVLIAGGGQVGALIARRLVRERNEVVVIEQDAARCREIEEQLDAHVIRGSAASVRALRQGGIADAEMLIAVTNADEINILACLIAQVESQVRVKVARVRTHEVDDWRRVCAASGLKIDLIIHPETSVAERIMRVMRLPGASDIIDFAEGRARLFGMNVEPLSWLAGKSFLDLERAGPPKDSLIVMVFRGSQVIIPHGGEVLRPGDHVYVMATRENLKETLRFMGLETKETLGRVFIIGGKQIGIRIAELLEEQNVNVKLFDINEARCEKIAGMLKKTVVIHGDGTDQTTLEEENIAGVDAFLALTHDDETNIIASLLARRFGAGKIVALINRPNYLHMAQLLGVNTTVSPRLAAVDHILQFVRKGRVLSVTTFREEEAEAIELLATEGMKYVGRPLRHVRFPRGAIVGAIVRPGGEVIVPRGDAMIEPRDRVIFFTLESVVPELESAFLVAPRRGYA
jgi:trk system potassium uptake protein TrkA